MPDPLPASLSVWLSATLAADADPSVRVVGEDLVRLAGAGCVCGGAAVVRAAPGQHVLPLLERRDLAGAVVVVGGLAGDRNAILGGSMAARLAALEVRALITDGTVRDIDEIRTTGISVWAAGSVPFAARTPAQCDDEETIVGDVVVRAGDVVVADEDGIVLWDADRLDELIRRARARQASDLERKARLAAEDANRAGSSA